MQLLERSEPGAASGAYGMARAQGALCRGGRTRRDGVDSFQGKVDMLRWVLVLGALCLAGCNDSEVRTYRIAPYLQPGQGECVECGIGLTLEARLEGGDRPAVGSFYRDAFEKGGFDFHWGVEQVIEVVVQHYDSNGMEDVYGTRTRFEKHLESHPVEPGSRFEMKFWEQPPGWYDDTFLVRASEGFTLDGKERIECETEALCAELADQPLDVGGFALELSYPATEGGPLRLHSLRKQ